MNLLAYPHLPMKDPATCLVLLEQMGFNAGLISGLTGYSPISVHKWKTKADRMTLPSTNAVNELTYRAAVAYRAQRLKDPQGPKLKWLRDALFDYAYGAVPLNDAPASLLRNLPDYQSESGE